VLTTTAAAKTKHHHPPTHTYLALFLTFSLCKEAFAPEEEMWEKRVKILATQTSKKKLYA